MFIYVIGAKTEAPTPVKIGFSENPSKRLRQLQTGHAHPLSLLYEEEVPAENVRALERIIHKNLKHHRTSGEWFNLSPEDAVAEVRFAVIRYGDLENLNMRLKGGLI